METGAGVGRWVREVVVPHRYMLAHLLGGRVVERSGCVVHVLPVGSAPVREETALMYPVDVLGAGLDESTSRRRSSSSRNLVESLSYMLRVCSLPGTEKPSDRVETPSTAGRVRSLLLQDGNGGGKPGRGLGLPLGILHLLQLKGLDRGGRVDAVADLVRDEAVREGLGVELVDGVDLAGVDGAFFQVLVAEAPVGCVEIRPAEEDVQRVVEEAVVSGVSIR